MHFGGTATTLAIDPSSGKVLRLTYRGRGPRLAFGTVDQEIREYREVSGLKVPVKTYASFDGERVDSMDMVIDEVRIGSRDKASDEATEPRSDEGEGERAKGERQGTKRRSHGG